MPQPPRGDNDQDHEDQADEQVLHQQARSGRTSRTCTSAAKHG